MLPIGGLERSGMVKRRAWTPSGEVVGREHSNPILDMRTYEVEFPDGRVAKYAANTIEEGMYAQCDANGRPQFLLKDIVDHKTDNTAVKHADRYVTVNGQQHHC